MYTTSVAAASGAFPRRRRLAARARSRARPFPRHGFALTLHSAASFASESLRSSALLCVDLSTSLACLRRGCYRAPRLVIMAAAPAPPLLGRVILVTACASAIGTAVARKLAGEGANLVLTDPAKAEGGELCQVRSRATAGADVDQELRATYPQMQLVFQACVPLADDADGSAST